MSLLYQLKESIAAGELTEPFTSHQVSQALCHPDWSLERVQNFLARHCLGNLATVDHYFERVSSGQYRLLRGTAGDRNRPAEPFAKH